MADDDKIIIKINGYGDYLYSSVQDDADNVFDHRLSAARKKIDIGDVRKEASALDREKRHFPARLSCENARGACGLRFLCDAAEWDLYPAMVREGYIKG